MQLGLSEKRRSNMLLPLFIVTLTFLSEISQGVDVLNCTKPDLNNFFIIDDFQKFAEKCMDRKSLTYVKTGSMLQQTLAENTAAFFRLRLQQKLLRNTGTKDIRTTILGHKIAMPIAICPNAFQQLESPFGENATAKAVLAANTLMILSAHSSLTMEEVAASSPNTMRWFQVVNFKNRGVTEDLLRRAKKSGYTAIVLTADDGVLSRRIEARRAMIKYSEFRNGNLEKYACLKPQDLDESPTLTWSELPWLKSITGLPLVVKGVLTAEDADLAVRNGADAIIVSTHGGRQLDGVPASIEALPDVVEAVRGRAEVYLDSGVRTGSDVFKALALGAKAVFIGRANLYGLFAGDDKGSRRVLQLLTDELTNVMDLIGATNISQLNRSYVKREEYYRQPLD